MKDEKKVKKKTLDSDWPLANKRPLRLRLRFSAKGGSFRAGVYVI